MKTILKAFIRTYAYLISPLSGAKCRFYPTCSAYAQVAIDRHGAVKGSVLTVKRLLKCHPWHKGEWTDSVPASIDWPALIGYKRSTNCCGGHAHPMKEDTDAKS